MRLRQLSHLVILLVAGIILSCAPKPKVPIVGEWKVSVHGSGTSAEQVGMRVKVNKDGTYVLTGGMDFQAVAQAREVTGRYEFTGEYDIQVEMDSKTFEFEPSTYTVQVISSSELVLVTQEYTITLRRIR